MGSSSAIYRITHAGKAACAIGAPQLRSRHLIDLLGLLDTSGHLRERELRQFMPPASLQNSIMALVGLGLIECEDT